MDSFINIPVPIDRVDEVYAVLGKPRAATRAPVAQPEAPDAKPAAPAAAVAEDVIVRAYRESPPGMKAVFDCLADRPEQEVPMKELAAGIDREPKQVSGVLGAFGRRWKNRYHQTGGWPFASWWDWDESQMHYRMSADVAAVIREARV